LQQKDCKSGESGICSAISEKLINIQTKFLKNLRIKKNSRLIMYVYHHEKKNIPYDHK